MGCMGEGGTGQRRTACGWGLGLICTVPTLPGWEVVLLLRYGHDAMMDESNKRSPDTLQTESPSLSLKQVHASCCSACLEIPSS